MYNQADIANLANICYTDQGSVGRTDSCTNVTDSELRFGTGGAGTKGYSYDPGDIANLATICYNQQAPVSRTDLCTFQVDTVLMDGTLGNDWQCTPDASTVCAGQVGLGSCYIPTSSFTQNCHDMNGCDIDKSRQANGTKMSNFQPDAAGYAWQHGGQIQACYNVASPEISLIDVNGCCPDDVILPAGASHGTCPSIWILDPSYLAALTALCDKQQMMVGLIDTTACGCSKSEMRPGLNHDPYC